VPRRDQPKGSKAAATSKSMKIKKTAMDCDLLPVNHAKFREVRESREFEFCRDQSWVCRKELPGRGLYWRHDRLHALSAYARAIAELKQSVSDRTSAGAAIVPDLAIGSHNSLGGIEGRSFRRESLDEVRHGLAILWVDTIQVLLNSRRSAGRIEAVHPK